jgi:hypothetical protein
VALSWLDHWITTFWQEGFQIQVLHWLWHEVFFFSFILNKSYRLSRARRWLLDGNYWNMKLIQNLKISRTTPKPVVCTSFHFTTTFSKMKNSIPTKLISIRKSILILPKSSCQIKLDGIRIREKLKLYCMFKYVLSGQHKHVVNYGYNPQNEQWIGNKKV